MARAVVVVLWQGGRLVLSGALIDYASWRWLFIVGAIGCSVEPFWSAERPCCHEGGAAGATASTRWALAGRNQGKLEQVRHEMADVLVYLIRLADKLDVDLHAAVLEKMVLNRAKYPADKVRGDARKYDEYPD